MQIAQRHISPVPAPAAPSHTHTATNPIVPCPTYYPALCPCTSPVPVQVLERSNRVELQPTIQQLFDGIHHAARNMVTATQAVPRVALQLTEQRKQEAQVRGSVAGGGLGAGRAFSKVPCRLWCLALPTPTVPLQCHHLHTAPLYQAAGAALPPPLGSHYEFISADEDAVLRNVVAITAGVTGTSEPVQVRVWQRGFRAQKAGPASSYLGGSGGRGSTCKHHSMLPAPLPPSFPSSTTTLLLPLPPGNAPCSWPFYIFSAASPSPTLPPCRLTGQPGAL